MKQSTLDILDAAMEFNVAVQEDHLNLQEMKYHLLQFNQSIDTLKTKSSYESVDVNFNAMMNKISMELLSMIDGSIADLDKQINYPHFLEVEDKTAIMYHHDTIWNMATCFREMLASIAHYGCSDINYKELKNKFMEENEMNMLLTNTMISDEDYVEMNIPQPKMQCTSDAGMTKDGLNECGKMLNCIVCQDILKELAATKYEVSAKMTSDREDAIKSAHFIAQIVMAIKNGIMLLQNYHNATLNELNPSIK